MGELNSARTKALIGLVVLISCSRQAFDCTNGIGARARRAAINRATARGNHAGIGELPVSSQRGDPIIQGRMRREEPATPFAGLVPDPTQCLDHHFLGIAGPPENLHRVAVRGVFLCTAITSGYQCSGQRCDRTATRNDLFQNRRSDVEARTQNLGFGDMAKILVSDLVGHDPAQLLIVRAAH